MDEIIQIIILIVVLYLIYKFVIYPFTPSGILSNISGGIHL